MILIGEAKVVFTETGCYTSYEDGTSYASHTHGTHHYHVISHRLGYEDDILRYCREHELLHHVAGYWIKSRHSEVIWPLAHGEKPDLIVSMNEELLVQTLQRWIRCNERPFIADVDWGIIKRNYLDLTQDLFPE